MPGITITLGTFNPPATPVVSHGAYAWPKTKVMTVRRRAEQFASRSTGPAPSLPADAYDDSAMEVPAADLWVVESFDRWVSTRRVNMVMEWRNLPTGTKVNGDLTEGSGSRAMETSFGFQVVPFPVPVTLDESLFSADLDGQDFTADDQTTHADYDVGSTNVQYIRTAANSIYLELTDSADDPLGSFFISPKWLTTCRMREGADFDVEQSSTRSIRLTWDAVDGYVLLMPAGWTYT